MDTKLIHFAILLGPVVLAYFVVGRLNAVSTATRNESERISRTFELVASTLLVLIVLKTVRHTEISIDLWRTFVIGFLIPIIVYLVVSAFAKVQRFSGIFSEERAIIKLLFSSFGGGNRGNLLLLVAFGAQLTFGPEVIKQFVILDLGNLVCLLTLGFWRISWLAIHRTERRIKAKHLSPREMVETFLKAPGTVVVVLILLQLPGLRETSIAKLISEVLVTDIDPILKATAPFLSPLFSFCIFLAIFVRIENSSEFREPLREVMPLFISSRIAAAVAVLAPMIFFHVHSELLVAIVVLTFMPPSSFLWTRIARTFPTIPKASRRNAIYLVPNFLYLVLLGGAFLWGLF